MVEQYPHIRTLPHCPNCREAKEAGLILCWSCHSMQKERNDGDYSPRLKRKLHAIEQALEAAR